MPTQTDPQNNKQEQKLNPAQQDWEETARADLEHIPTRQEGIASEEGAINQARARLRSNEAVASGEAAQPAKSLAQKESQPNLYNGSDTSTSRVTDTTSGMNPKLKRWLYIGIPSALITMAFALASFVAGSLISLKELAVDFFSKNHYSAYSRRTPKLQKSIFQEPDTNCQGIRCRIKGGVSDKALKKYEKAGWQMNIGEKDGQKWIRSATVPTPTGPVTIDAGNFEEQYVKNPRIRGGAWVISQPKALTYRAKHAVKKYSQFDISRNRLFKKASDARKYFYGGGKRSSPDIGKGTGAESNDPNLDETQQNQLNKARESLGEIDNTIIEAADAERQRLIDCDYECRPTVVPDLNNLDVDVDGAAAIGQGVIQGGAQGGAKAIGFGVLNWIDRACTGYQFVRTMVFGAKIFKYAGLILFAMSFMTHGDALKTGALTYESLGLIAGWLMRPSTEADSLGKTAANSNLYSLITEGKVQSRFGLAYGVMGTPLLKMFQAAKKFFENAGASKTTCQHVSSWYGQTLLLIGGVGLTLLTGGGGAWFGVASSALIGGAIAVIVQFATPFLVQYVAGTVATDPEDPGGGYKAGEQIAAGLEGLSAELGKGGERPLLESEFATVNQETNEQMALINQVEREGKNPFDVTVPNSIANRFALAIAPYVAAPTSTVNYQQLASIVTSPLGLLGNAVNQLFYQKVSAQSVDYGGEFCADEDMLEMGLVRGAYCNPVYGETAANLEDNKYAPEVAIDYMVEKNHANLEDGSARSDEYQKFRASCVDGTVPFTPDGGGEDVSDTSVDTRLCWKTENNDTFTLTHDYFDRPGGTILVANDGTQLRKGAKINISRELMFMRFVMDTNILDGMDASADGSLGI